MNIDNFQKIARVLAGLACILCANAGFTESAERAQHGIAMYGDPALPPDFVSLPYANPDAPKGGTLVLGNTGAFDQLNPFVRKGSAPWQLRFLAYESLLGRSWDEPFTLYGVLAASVRTADDRSWVEYDLHPDARFVDGTPVTVEDVIWSFETLGTVGHPRYLSLWGKIDNIAAVGERSVRITFNEANRELALLTGLRPILKKAGWETKDFANAPLADIPVGSAPYSVTDYVAGRTLTLTRNTDYWGRDIPFRRGTHNFDEIKIEFFGDATVLFEAFKAGQLSAVRETNAATWATQYAFPAVTEGQIVKSEIKHSKPTGMTGLVMNTRRPPFDDIRVRDALLHAFNFEFINDTLTGGTQPRIKSYFSNSVLGYEAGPAPAAEMALLAPFADALPVEAVEGYALPVADGSARNRAGIRKALALLQEAGFTTQDGVMMTPKGAPFAFEIVLPKGSPEQQAIVQLYVQGLKRLGIAPVISTVDGAQYTSRMHSFDFDMTPFRIALSLSPGNEQRYYWGSDAADIEASRNLAGIKSPAADAMIDAMLGATSSEDFIAATRALDRVLTAGRYAIPFWQFDVDRIAHRAEFKFSDVTPIYGDGPNFMPDVWWYAP